MTPKTLRRRREKWRNRQSKSRQILQTKEVQMALALSADSCATDQNLTKVYGTNRSTRIRRKFPSLTHPRVDVAIRVRTPGAVEIAVLVTHAATVKFNRLGPTASCMIWDVDLVNVICPLSHIILLLLLRHQSSCQIIAEVSINLQSLSLPDAIVEPLDVDDVNPSLESLSHALGQVFDRLRCAYDASHTFVHLRCYHRSL
mmetsp:Transcript_4685/g.10454  ORF Transcript_4685/g.10454 Transcript_4685/m.10454 type:complete len:201 (-) Transcript_4685:413-1015(-)